MNYFIVNAFTESMAGGNPAAVCITEKKLSESVMQKIASDFGLSETAFIEKNQDVFKLRWFTPTTEVDLCGHATLAGAHILWEQDIVDQNSTIFFDIDKPTPKPSCLVVKKGLNSLLRTAVLMPDP